MEALSDAVARVADWRERAKEMADENLSEMEALVETMDPSSMRVAPAPFETEATVDRFEWQRARSLRERQNVAAHEADKAALAAIVRCNPQSALEKDQTKTVKYTVNVTRERVVPGGCCSKPKVNKIHVVESRERDETVPAWGWGVGQHDDGTWKGVEIDPDSGLVVRLDLTGSLVTVFPEEAVMRGMTKLEGVRVSGDSGGRFLPLDEVLIEGVIRNTGDVGKVVELMETHAGRPDVQECACRALTKLTWDDDNEVRAGKAGAVEAVVSAMQRHADSAGVQEHACWALKNMTVNADNEVRAGKAGALEAVLSAMQRHADTAAVQEQACWALRYMSNNADNKVRAGEAGAVEAVRAAMQRHADSAVVQEQGKIALQRLE